MIDPHQDPDDILNLGWVPLIVNGETYRLPTDPPDSFFLLVAAARPRDALRTVLPSETADRIAAGLSIDDVRSLQRTVASRYHIEIKRRNNQMRHNLYRNLKRRRTA